MVTPKRLFNSLAIQTSSPGTALYTAPPQTRCVIKKLSFVNTDGSNAITLSVYIVRPGQAATLDAAEAVWLLKTFAPLETKTCNEALDQVLEPGDMLYAVASAGTVTGHGSGYEITT